MFDIASYIIVFQAIVKMLGFFWPLIVMAAVLIMWSSRSRRV
jgi:hypothetical protein